MKLNLKELITTKNLLAFSSGVDSSALFFILLENNIPFDMVMVNYNLRKQSKNEVIYAKKLAKKYKKKIYIKEVFLKGNNIESRARKIRYDFFEKIIDSEGYDTLITAHQLNDKLEWFFMQLSKGAGLSELIGLKEKQQRKNYLLFRPLLNTSKQFLEKYLKSNDIKHFIDETNFEIKYKRNYFRHLFSDKFIENFEKGVINSFKYLEKDLSSLNIDYNFIFNKKDLFIFKNLKEDNINIKIIDKHLKKKGILLSKSQRNEVLRQKQGVVSNKYSVCIEKDYIWISPFVKNIKSKKFKEFCRINVIPTLCRSYIFEENINMEQFLKKTIQKSVSCD